MGEKLVIGPINRGLRTDREPFIIDNDSFPTLINAYQWRGRIKRKRGTSLLGNLNRFLDTTNGAGSVTINIKPIPIASGIVSFQVGTDVFYDPGGASPVTLLTNSSGSAVLDRTLGVLIITGSQPNTSVIYFPTLPVMGLEDFFPNSVEFPATIAFDTDYSYNISTAFPYPIWDVSFYKNPATDGTNLPSYVRKTTWTPTTWNGQNYQQFWTTNYEGALWATNGIDVPFTGATIGMQYAGPTTTPKLSAAVWVNATTMQFTVVGNPLARGDFVFANEFSGGSGLNFQTGYVTVAGNTFTVKFPDATIANAVYTPGILQYLTNRSDTTKDSLRWYDGDPTAGGGTTPSGPLGWINFAPPLSQNAFSIGGLPADIYYLVGARIIFPFKDRLLFFGAVVQTSTGAPIYLQDTIIYSQNGTPYYTASYTNTPDATKDTPTSASNIFTPIIVPGPTTNPPAFTASPCAFFCDQTGFGGFLTAGVNQPILSLGQNEDALIVGFLNFQSRLLYTGNDIVPFGLFIINSELGSGSTFSAVTMDQGVLTLGGRGFVITGQTSAERFDLQIPDQVFEITLANNGFERVCSQRDFISEWVYFTYTTNEDNSTFYVFPNQTLQYNYRDNSWAIFNETYTTYGSFRPSSGNTWATIGKVYSSWLDWNEPWIAGSTTLFQPKVIAGNQQGFVLFREEGTNEGASLTIQNISGSTITSPNHGLNFGDYIMISGVLGSLGSQVNGLIFSVDVITDANTFDLNPSITGGAYQGGGVITRMYVPFIQTKQFPVAWELSRKTRLGPQQYLFTQTSNAQVTLLIFLSQDGSNGWNDSPIVPNVDSINNSLLYSTILYTCRESTNLGLTSFNTNLQNLTQISSDGSSSNAQQQIWHRMNTSLIGDTVQIGFTMSDTQMRTLDDNGLPISQFAEIEFHSAILDINPSQMLS